MSITLALASLLLFALRYRRGSVSREEKILWRLWFVHFLIVAPLAIYSEPHHRLDTRYVKPVDCLVWGILIAEILKHRFGKMMLTGALSLMVIYNAIMFTKHLIPGSRRNANYLACDWAMEKIKADFKGDKSAPNLFLCDEYTSGGSPVIQPISKRMTFLMGARAANPVFEEDGVPDYIVEEDKRLKFEPWNKDDYILLDELQIKKRHYSLFKRRSY